MPTEKEILFTGFSDADRSEFLEMGREARVKMHDMVLTEGEPGGSMYIIEDGNVSIWFRGSRLADLGRGDTLGTMVVLTAEQRTATVRAESDVTVREFSRDEIMNYFKRKPQRLFQQFFVNLAKIQINLTTRANQRIMDLDRRLREQG